MWCHFCNLLNCKILKEIDGVGIGCLGIFLSHSNSYVELVDLFFCHRRPVSGNFLLVKVEIIFKVSVEIVVNVSDFRLNYRLKFFKAEATAPFDIFLSLFFRFCS
jgi:hypothetical protein